MAAQIPFVQGAFVALDGLPITVENTWLATALPAFPTSGSRDGSGLGSNPASLRTFRHYGSHSPGTV
jgi:hypothetical protein